MNQSLLTVRNAVLAGFIGWIHPTTVIGEDNALNDEHRTKEYPGLTSEGVVISEGYIRAQIAIQEAKNADRPPPQAFNPFRIADPRKLVFNLYRRELDVDQVLKFQSLAIELAPENELQIGKIFRERLEDQAVTFDADVVNVVLSGDDRDDAINSIVEAELRRSKKVAADLRETLTAKHLERLVDFVIKRRGPFALGHPLIASTLGVDDKSLLKMRQRLSNAYDLAPPPPWLEDAKDPHQSKRDKLLLAVLTSLEAAQLERYLRVRGELNIRNNLPGVDGTYSPSVKQTLTQYLQEAKQPSAE